MIWYGLIRFIIEGKRIDSLMLGNFKMAQIVSIIMIISGIVLFIYYSKIKKYGPFEKLYNKKEEELKERPPLFVKVN